MRRKCSFEKVCQPVVCKQNEIFLFLVTKVTGYFCFLQAVNSIRGHGSLLLVLRTCLKPGSCLCVKHNTSDISISDISIGMFLFSCAYAYAYVTCVMLIAQM